MKILILLFSLTLLSCKGAGTTATLSDQTNSNPTSYWTQNRVDNNVQRIVFDVVNGGMSYYSSTTTFNDTDLFTIPEYIDIDNDSLGTIHSDDYIELQIANRTFCHYYKMTNYFQFQGCQTTDNSITWTIQANDTYRMNDLNSNAVLTDKNKVIMVLKRHSSCTGNCLFNGHIGFSYDL
jgi:hypothetical protein